MAAYKNGYWELANPLVIPCETASAMQAIGNIIFYRYKGSAQRYWIRAFTRIAAYSEQVEFAVEGPES